MQIFPRTGASRIALPFAAVALFAASLATPLHAQAGGAGGGGGKSIGRLSFGGSDNSAPNVARTDRLLRGRVLDKDGAPVKGAYVYLKEYAKQGKSSTLKTVTTDQDGVYRFAQLATNLDSELWAQVDEKHKSEQKTISSFDNRTEVVMNLHFEDPAKAAAPAKTEPVAKPAAAAKP
ncbi:Carboxypeptidase regulatory-like domain-containing protein [Granulicella rosea]|uniref:Carboxypeptidase regulatory-like domain-containing protein n=1 Tax=Granulicella rosea TaxID=474952 RepID=A0A239LTA3_9BACT|nr:carboxypeptidase-like regulatory domain-containing protein [Granulicella rosea]SNT33033.1 Carboxypeptidase regulatory-like domain-containing protein [Granulicella rosea]